MGFPSFPALDPEWAFAPYLHIVYKTIESPQSFGANTPAVVNVTGGDSLTIALAGDWGTGA